MANKSEITERLAERLKEERKAKGLSLDALAKLSGISRSMLSQIERGESSPTVASLWNLTRALNLDFSQLLDQETISANPIQEVLEAGQTPTLQDTTSGCEIRILSPTSEVGGTEVYDIRFDKNSNLTSSAHKQGCVEHLTVLSGEVEVRSDNETTVAKEGDTIRYRADVDHSIGTKRTARILLIVKNA